MPMEPIFEFLARVETFKNFSESELGLIVRVTNRRTFKAGEFICREGDVGDSMYIVKTGVVRISRMAEDGRGVTMARLTEGNVIGEMALIDDEVRSASLQAEEDVIVYEIRRRSFEDMMAAMDPTAYKLLRQMSRLACERIRKVNSQVDFYINNPRNLFEPEVESGTQKTVATVKVKGRINKFLGLFGSGERKGA